MKILVESLGVAILTDFPYSVESVNLLILLSKHNENIPVRVHTLNGHAIFVPVFRLVLSRESLRMLNP